MSSSMNHRTPEERIKFLEEQRRRLSRAVVGLPANRRKLRDATLEALRLEVEGRS